MTHIVITINNMITFKEFIDIVNTRFLPDESQSQYGQILMSTLNEIWPEKYTQIIGSEYDCSHEDGWSFSVANTINKLESDWKNA